MGTIVGRGQILHGLNLSYRGLENRHLYKMKIWSNFTGISYSEFDENDKKISHEVYHYKVSSWDYQTAFALLRSHFNLEKRMEPNG